ncbi:MAG: hypothetical protein IPJ34_10760 [Myxococcales bacterium]|nr:hypothetical protein [Myxococcales bacterium]
MTDPRAAQALEYIKEQIRDLEARLAELRGAANGIARAAGLPPVYGVSPTTTPPGLPAVTIPLAQLKQVTPGQFAQYDTLAEAARAFFEWRGRALGFCSLTEIHDCLVDGGAPFRRKGEAARDELRIALGQDREIARLRNDYYGLARWQKKERTSPPSEG